MGKQQGKNNESLNEWFKEYSAYVQPTNISEDNNVDDDLSLEDWMNQYQGLVKPKKKSMDLSGETSSMDSTSNVFDEALSSIKTYPSLSPVSDFVLQKAIPKNKEKQELQKWLYESDPDTKKAYEDHVQKLYKGYDALSSWYNFMGIPTFDSPTLNSLVIGAQDFTSQILGGTMALAASAGRDIINSISQKVTGDDLIKKDGLGLSEINNVLEVTKGFSDIVNAKRKVDAGFAPEDINKNFLDLLEEGKLEDAGSALGYEFVELIPSLYVNMGAGNLAGRAITKFAGTGAKASTRFGQATAKLLQGAEKLGISNAANRLGVLGATTILDTPRQISQEFTSPYGDDYVSGLDYIVAPAKAFVEGLTESIGMRDRVAVESMRKAFAGKTAQEIANTIIRTPKQVIKNTLGGAMEEGLEEVFSSVGQFGVDVIAGRKEATTDNINDLVEEATHGFILGALSGGALSGGAAFLSMQSYSMEEKQLIKNLERDIANEKLPQDVREIAAQKLLDIKNEVSMRRFDIYKTIANIKDVDERVAAMRLFKETDEFFEQKESVVDETVKKRLEQNIADNELRIQEILDKDFMSKQADKIGQDLSILIKAKKDAEAFLATNNMFQSYLNRTENLRRKLEGKPKVEDGIETNELDLTDVEAKTLAEATDSLYELFTQVKQAESLSSLQKGQIIGKILQEINQFEKYEGTRITVTNRSERVGAKKRMKKYVRASRFDGERLIGTDINGNKLKYEASVNENGNIVLTPQSTYTRDEKTGQRTIVKNTPIELTEGFKFINIQRKNDGDFKQGTIIDPVTKTKFVTKNKGLAFYAKNTTFADPFIQDTSKSLLVDESIEFSDSPLLDKLTPDDKTRLLTYYNFLKEINPEAKITLFNNSESLRSYLKNTLGFTNTSSKVLSKGRYGLAAKGNEVLINLEEIANAISNENAPLTNEERNYLLSRTVAHEIFHVAIKDIAKNNPKLFLSMVDRIQNYLRKSDSADLKSFAERYVGKDFTDEDIAEEYLTELGGMMAVNAETTLNFSKTTVGTTFKKIALLMRNLLKKVVAKFNNQQLNDLVDRVFSNLNTNAELIEFFNMFARGMRGQGNYDTDILTRLQEKLEVIDQSETINELKKGQVGEGLGAMQVPAEGVTYNKIEDAKSSLVGDYKFDSKIAPKIANIKTITMAEAVRMNGGRVAFATSDATGYGVDSKGNPILGGFGYMMIEQNVKDGIGFASKDSFTPKSFLTMIRNKIGNGKVTVFVVIQSPSTTLNNSYGATYFARGLKEVLKTYPQLKEDIKKSIVDKINSTAKIKSEFKSNDLMNATIALFNSIDENMNEAEFVNELMKDTTFQLRANLLNVLLPSRKDIGKSHKNALVKDLFKAIGYSAENFLSEYGDNTILNSDMILNDKAGTIVGGFEIEIKDKEVQDKEIDELQEKGITHPLFNGKMPGTNHFILDGKYDLVENFGDYAAINSSIDNNVLSKEEIQKLVQEKYPDEKYYDKKKMKKPSFVWENRTYADLSATYSIEFKNTVIKEKGALVYKKATKQLPAKVSQQNEFPLNPDTLPDLLEVNYNKIDDAKSSLAADKFNSPLKVRDKGARAERIARKADFAYKVAKKVLGGVYTGVFERNADIARRMKDAEMQKAIMYMYTKAGATQAGLYKAAMANHNIFRDLNESQRAALNAIVFYRRVIAIDTNFDNRRQTQLDNIESIKNQINILNEKLQEDLSDREKVRIFKAINELTDSIAEIQKNLIERPSHTTTQRMPDGTEGEFKTNKELAERYLNQMENLYGEEYEELFKRSDAVFKVFQEILDYKRNNGLITDEEYELYKNYNYVPRRFLQHIYSITELDTNGELEEKLSTSIASNYYTHGSILNKEEIDRIDKGSTELLEEDVQKLIEDALVMAQIRVKTNQMLTVLNEEKAFANFGFVKEANYVRYADGTLKRNSDGSFKYNKADDGYINVVYKENGKRKAFQLKTELVDQLLDNTYKDNSISAQRMWELLKKSIETGKFLIPIDKKLLRFIGESALMIPSVALKLTATGVNPYFAIANLQLDLNTQIFFTNTYGENLSQAYYEATTGSMELAKLLTELQINPDSKNNEYIKNLLEQYYESGSGMMTLTEQYSVKSRNKTLNSILDALKMPGAISEIATKLNAFRATRERLSEEFYSKKGYYPTNKDLDYINVEAAFEARSSLDFNRGGSLTKRLDRFAPYLNVFFQGAKIGVKYAIENPKAFVSKLLQSQIGIGMITHYNLMIGADDIDNDDLFEDMMNGLVIFKPYKNKDGKRDYFIIRTPMFLKTFLNPLQNAIIYAYLKDISKQPERAERFINKTGKGIDANTLLGRTVSMALPTSLKVLIEYATDWNLYYGTRLSNAYKETISGAEGDMDTKVLYAIKLLGGYVDYKYNGGEKPEEGLFSPVKVQNTLNTMFAQNNPLVSGAYGLIDFFAYTAAGTEPGSPFASKFAEPGEGLGSTILKNFSMTFNNRVVKTTDPYSVDYDLVKKMQTRTKLAGVEKDQMKAMVSQMVGIKLDERETLRGFDMTEIIDAVVEKYGANYYSTILNGVNKEAVSRIINYPNLNSYYNIIAYDDTPKSKLDNLKDLIKLGKSKNLDMKLLFEDISLQKLWGNNPGSEELYNEFKDKYLNKESINQK